MPLGYSDRFGGAQAHFFVGEPLNLFPDAAAACFACSGFNGDALVKWGVCCLTPNILFVALAWVVEAVVLQVGRLST